jgi:LppX_LprAFG lipoprotein
VGKGRRSEGIVQRRLGFEGIVVALAITAAACGSGGGGGDAAVSIKTLQAAVSNSQAESSSRFVMDLAVDARGQSTTIHADGVVAGDGKNGQITMTVPSAGTLEERIVDGTVYMNFGALLGTNETGGKQWVKVGLDDLPQSAGSVSSLADQAGSNGPQQGLEYLRGLSGDVQKIGDDTVGGAPATHYRASIDYAKAAAKLPATSAKVRDALAKLGTVPADVWINDDDRVVKMQFAIDGSAFGADGGKIQMTMEISDFGVPVDVQAPPADQTIDFAQLGAKPA